MRDPSEFAKYFTMRLSLNWKYRAGILSPSAIRSRSTDWTSAIFSSTGTSASFRCSGIDQFISIASSCANVIFVLRREAFATLIASSTIARTSAFVRRFVAANPRAPFTRTRTPTPRSWPTYSASRTPFLRMKFCCSWCSYRASFDLARTSDQGRRVAKRWAVESPTAQEVTAAAKALGLQPELEEGKAFPSTPWRKEGRVLVRADYYKTSILQKVAQRIKESR